MEINNLSNIDFTEIGYLKAIRFFAGPEWKMDLYHEEDIVQIEFLFSNGRFTIGVNEDYDTITVSSIPLLREDWNGNPNLHHGFREFFENLHSYSILWAWQLTNQQGYTDAVQMEFYDRDCAKSVSCQFLAIASRINIYVLKRFV